MSLKTYSVKIGGAERELFYGVNALSAIQKELGENPVKIITSGFSPLDFNTVRIILWAGLLHSARKITPEIVGDWMDKKETPYAKLVEISIAAVSDSCDMVCDFGTEEEDEEEPEKN